MLRRKGFVVILAVLFANTMYAQLGGVGISAGVSDQLNGEESLYTLGLRGEYELINKGIGFALGGNYMFTNNASNYFDASNDRDVIISESGEGFRPTLTIFAPYVGAYYTKKGNDAAKVTYRAGLNVGYMLADYSDELFSSELSSGAPFAEVQGGAVVYFNEHLSVSANVGFLAGFTELEFEPDRVLFADSPDDFAAEEVVDGEAFTTMPLHLNFSLGVNYVFGHKWRY